MNAAAIADTPSASSEPQPSFRLPIHETGRDAPTHLLKQSCHTLTAGEAGSIVRIGLGDLLSQAQVATVLLLVSAVVASPAGAQTSVQQNEEGAQASKPGNSDQIVVTGRRLDLVGEAISASEGLIGRQDINSRPILRSGDLLEFVPGLVATQHSGSGKANQYFLRGFNLDHGTDFATSVDAMPVNMRTHGHGQGWTDLNFMIPEAVEQLRYRKGTYYADVGDFSSTGSARFQIADTMRRGLAEVTAGSFGFLRGVVVDSVRLGGSDLLFAGELQTFDGQWTDIDEDVRKKSGLLRYGREVGSGRRI